MPPAKIGGGPLQLLFFTRLHHFVPCLWAILADKDDPRGGRRPHKKGKLGVVKIGLGTDIFGSEGSIKVADGIAIRFCVEDRAEGPLATGLRDILDDQFSPFGPFRYLPDILSKVRG